MSLKSLRKASGLTQREAADKFGLKYRTYQNYENGVTSPDMDTAAEFARYFGCTIGDLFDLREGLDSSLSAQEREVVEAMRSMSEDARRALVKVTRGLVMAFPDE